MPVYIDVLLVVNGFINYLLLLLTMKILGCKTGRLRLLAGSIVGSLFSLKIFLPEIPYIFEFFLRIAFAATIVLVSFKFSSAISFVKAFSAFFGVNFALSGVIIALIYLFNPPNLLYDNGIIYYNLSFISIIALSTVSFFIITLIEKLLERKSDIQKIYEVSVFYNEQQIKGRGLLDTGNSLKEPFSNEGVIVADKSAVKKIMPPGITDYFESKSLNQIRIIPVSTVNGTGLLPAFKSDKIEITSIKEKVTKKDIYIAVSKEKFCNGEFEFLLYNNILEDNENEKNLRIYK